jgi:hypothetical protein
LDTNSENLNEEDEFVNSPQYNNYSSVYIGSTTKTLPDYLTATPIDNRNKVATNRISSFTAGPGAQTELKETRNKIYDTELK